ncbi:MAG: hypothetical protein ACREFP_23925 [Acetobacteraceae bacterium]
MSDASVGRLFRKRRLRRYARHGNIYAWLRTYHDQLADALAKGEQSWSSLVAEMGRDGVVGRDGQRLTPNAALKVWRRVCRDVASLRQAPSARPGSVYPSRMQKNARPIPMASPQGGALVGGSTANAGKDDEPYDWRKRLAQLNRTIDERSGRKG